MDGSAMLTIEASRKSRKPTAQRKTRTSFPRRVARKDMLKTSGLTCNSVISQLTNLDERSANVYTCEHND